MKRFPTLYKRTSTGAQQQWTIMSDGPAYTTEEGQVNGKLSTSAPHVCTPMNPGKANATTAEQQAEKEAQAKWEKKQKLGYCGSLDAIDLVTFRKPMKGDNWADRQNEAVFPCTVQDKLNGVRAQSDRERSYSTGGETFHTVPHIREALAPIFAKYPEAFLDGEWFNFTLRRNLNRLIELVAVTKKPQHLTPELLAESRRIVQLHLFDGFGFEGILPTTPYNQRLAAVTKLIAQYPSPYLHVLTSRPLHNPDELTAMMEQNRKEGGEGLMIRWGDCPYKAGRSKYLNKFKHEEDQEFKILDIQEGNADWAGCAKRIVLELPEPVIGRDGKMQTSFDSNIEGDREWLRRLFLRKAEFIGQPATTTYQHLSEYGVPQLAFVRVIRNYENS